ncbi:MAG: ScpA family protein [Pseudomonadota bacterium]
MFDDAGPAFEEDLPDGDPTETLILRLDGYEGPLDALLDLAHRQKVDLREISVLALTEQYLAFVEEARSRNLQLAADYLVMASWLTYLKTRLLLPSQEDDEELSGEEIASILAHRLRRLDAMRKAAQALTDRPLVGRDVFVAGRRATEVKRTTHTAADLWDLLQAYSTQRLRAAPPEKRSDPIPVFRIEQARDELKLALMASRDWFNIVGIRPRMSGDAPLSSVVASTFTAALEAGRDGDALLRQEALFEPIYVKGAS